MAKLLKEFVDIKDIDTIKEDVDTSDGTVEQYYLKGPFLQGGKVLNRNKRRYETKTIGREVSRYNEEFIKTNRSLGELQHPDSCEVNLDRSSHIITKLYMDGDIGYGEMRLLNTPMGRIAKTLVDERILLGVSSRGVGTLNGDIVDDSYVYICEDIVHNPSAHVAFVEGIIENKEYILGKDIDNLKEYVINKDKTITEVVKDLKVVEQDKIIVGNAIDTLKSKVDKKSNRFEHKDVSKVTLQYMLEFINDVNKRVI